MSPFSSSAAAAMSFRFLSLLLMIGVSGAVDDAQTLSPALDIVARLSQRGSTLRGGLHRRIAGVKETISSSAGPWSKAFQAPLDVAPRRDRRLETCEASEVYEDDDDNLAIFAPTFQPMCTCKDIEPDFGNLGNDINITGIAANVSLSDPTAGEQILNATLEALLPDFNSAFTDLSFTEESDCYNDCSSCLLPSAYCAYLEETSVYSGSMDLARDLTLSDLLFVGADNTTEQQTNEFFQSIILFGQLTFFERQCYDFISGAEQGKVCATIDFDYKPATPLTLAEFESLDLTTLVQPDLFLRVDGVNCNSCAFNTTNPEEFCFACDCTNILAGSNPTDCVSSDARATFTGIFEPFYDFGVSEDTYGSNFTVGECGGARPPTGQPSSSPSADPTSGTAAVSHLLTVVSVWSVAVGMMAAVVVW